MHGSLPPIEQPRRHRVCAWAIQLVALIMWGEIILMLKLLVWLVT
jgi:hypothetical protein